MLIIGLSSGVFFLVFHEALRIEAGNALLYSVALSILSSAIIIPSVANFPETTKLFLTLESAFSDVVGVVLFSFLQNSKEVSVGSVALYSGEILLTIGIALIAVLLITLLMQINQAKVKYFIIFASLLLLYGVGKHFHLPVLILVLFWALSSKY